MFDLHAALRHLVASDGSDLHLKVPTAPVIRRRGGLEAIPGSDPLAAEDTERVLFGMLTDEGKVVEFRS